ncbi:hypothetical protein O6H91_23G061500 [Diphasiastrum complanatum]|uniref:Uncharacterized protein n=1 Tax=Diphasiastrum complanatum TaxID=34168 RepID=A0ACC2ABA6_DIPCM|nr:hypothetical protein O6H91_23G061500 [Diphasiastrum complanatum]
MIWTTIILINVVFIAFTIICYVKAAKIPGSEIGRKLDEAIKPMPSLFDPSKNDKKIFLYIAYILSAFSGLLILFTLLLCQRVVIAIGCVKVASRAMESMPSILIFPFLPFLMAVMLVAWWLVVAIFLYSDSQVVKYSGGGYSLTWDYTTRYLLIYHLFGLLWTWQFIVGFSYVVIAGIFSSYYWCRGDSSLASSTMITSLYRAVTYHLGSIALGSLIVAVIQLVRMIFQYLNKKFKKLRSIAWLPSITMSCLGCCICALEKILKFVNRNAYIVIAMKGTNYCSSASRAVSLIISNALRVATVTIVGDVVIWLGKVFVSCTCGIAALLMSEAKMYSDASSRTYISSPLFPVIFSLIVAYFVAHLFMQLYDIGIDTILLCFCEDCERHNGSPSFAPPSLMTAVGALRKPTTAFE